ncbi:uncharacterized protein METZ01_LOCUS184450, partial [marine metagenome]
QRLDPHRGAVHLWGDGWGFVPSQLSRWVGPDLGCSFRAYCRAGCRRICTSL